MRRAIMISLCIVLSSLSCAQAAGPAPREPYGIALEGFAYPYPVHLLPVVNDGEQLSMAYMDVAAAQPNGRTVVLLHGRNFPSSYWAPLIKMLSEAGYRVLVPDQIGFGKSSKPQGDLHFDTLARNTIALLDHLRIDRCHLYGQCIGGSFIMSLLKAQPQRIASAVLAQPIGRVGAMAAARSARFEAWAATLTDHPEATPAVLEAFYQNLYAPGFVYSADRAFASTCTTPCLVLAGNDEAHPLPISEELAKLLPRCEFIREWKTGAALESARVQVKGFLTKHTPRA